METLATPKSFGRIAAQTAKQVVLQRIKDAERQILYDEFSGKLQEVVTGVVRRVENGNVFLELGRSECLLPVSEQVPGEVYTPGDRLKVYVLKVDRDARNRDTSVIVSRKNREIIKRLFELEVPEIMAGVVKIKACEAVKKSKKLLKFTLDDGSGTDRIILSGINDYYEPEELSLIHL